MVHLRKNRWKKIPWTSVVFMMTLAFSALSSAAPPQKATIKSLYGTIELDDPLVRSLIVHPAVKRLRLIDNGGPSRYFRSLPAYSLFDHALGVFVILKRFGRPTKEQVAGLLEPIAHSVFSHQGTLYLRPKGSNLPYYLAAHQGYLKTVGLGPWLEKAHFTAESLNPMDPQFKALFQNPPLLSAIEIEMTLRLAYSFKLLTNQEVLDVMDDLRFEEGQWFFVSEKSADKLAGLSLYFAQRYWGAPQSYVVNRWVAAAMKRAVDLGALSVKEIRFGADKQVLQKLMRLKDKVIHGLLIQCRQPFRFYEVVDGDVFDELYKPEFRGLDPLVKQGAKFVRLTELNADYKKRFETLRQKFVQGIKIKFKKPVKPSGFSSFSGGSFSGIEYNLNVSLEDDATGVVLADSAFEDKG